MSTVMLDLPASIPDQPHGVLEDCDMATIEVSVAASSDDVYMRRQGLIFSLTQTYLVSGDGNSSDYGYQAGMRFTGLPNDLKDATIAEARLIVVAAFAADPTALGTDIIIDGEANASPATFSTRAEYDARSRTTAQVAWTPASWEAEVEQTSPDIKSIIEEIVALWGPTDTDLVLFCQDTSKDTYGGVDLTRFFLASFNHATLAAPKLQIVTADAGINKTVLRRRLEAARYG